MTVEYEETLRGIETVRVNKDTLLDRIKVNRDEHRAIFEEALEGWKKKVTEELEKAYQSAFKGKDFVTSIYLPRPEDHTDEYDTVIELLEMSLDEELELSRHEFACYALDKWQWQAAFLATSTNYGSGLAQMKQDDTKPPKFRR